MTFAIMGHLMFGTAMFMRQVHISGACGVNVQWTLSHLLWLGKNCPRILGLLTNFALTVAAHRVGSGLEEWSTMEDTLQTLVAQVLPPRLLSIC